MTGQKTVDPAIEAARITRRGAVTAALITALIAGAATGVSAYYAGRKQGTDSAAVTVVRTETVTVSGGAPVQQAVPGGKSLLDLNPVEEAGVNVVGARRVDTRDYQRTIAMVMGACGRSGSLASRTYHLDRKFKRLRVKAGLDDGSKSGHSVEFRVFVDDTKIDSATFQLGLGQVRDLDVDVTNALRIRLEAAFLGGSCYSEQQVSAVWIEPALS
ncbi:NPCBM/NEW2 domain-containing protein [Lentzea sp. BCCO 10_0856]|uniref:NPCBM/NEW2 domain-containing protein n=1 Tax=Lentzea miocenica TaxID=3095431 RepID=A0ABU4SWR9_9PSEU|nr:NPCBM/NEW2 domain-containing protein [Lentzea sp. BCCO 10_0856]MDX8030362.1 NPCBM/NEW2 domain-containing protein [Lentzea sp. BCCO 10_0856]